MIACPCCLKNSACNVGSWQHYAAGLVRVSSHLSGTDSGRDSGPAHVSGTDSGRDSGPTRVSVQAFSTQIELSLRQCHSTYN